jgi:DHA1 family tetracycline resistance protein-like MFS transporter
MRHLTKDLWLIFACQFLFAVGLGMYNFLWPAYIRELSGTAVDIGFLTGLGAAVGLLFTLPSGWVADRFERRAMIILGWAVAVPVPVMFILARTWQGLIPGLLLFSAGIVFFPAVQAYIMHEAPPGREAFVYSLVMSSFSAGMVAGPPLGGWLADRAGMKAVFLAVTVLWTLATVVLLPLRKQYPHRAASPTPPPSGGRPATRSGAPPPSGGRPATRAVATPAPPPPSRGRLAALRDSLLIVTPETLALTGLFVLVFGAQGLGYTFITPYLQDVAKMDLFWISNLGAIGSLGGALAVPAIGWLADRYGRLRVFALVQMVLASGFAVMLLTAPLVGMGATATASRWALVIMAVFSLTRGVSGMSLAFAIAGAAVPVDKRGRAFVLVHLAVGAGTAVFPYAGGLLYEAAPGLPFLTATVLLAGLGMTVLSAERRRRR